jgi:hypothetical protein
MPVGWAFGLPRSKALHKRVCTARDSFDPAKAIVYQYRNPEDKAALMAALNRKECSRCAEFFEAEWRLGGGGSAGGITSGAAAGAAAGTAAALASSFMAATGATAANAVARMATTAARTAACRVAHNATRNLLGKVA